MNNRAMNHPSDLIDEIVKNQLKPALHELGFKNKSSTFFRQNGELIEIVSPQKSKWNGSAEGKFTINLGVCWPNVQEILGRACKAFPPKDYECTLRQRLGSLFADGRDYWWTVIPDSDARRIGEEVLEKLRSFGIPWLRRATSVDEAPGMAPTAEAVVLHAIRGERALATSLLNEAFAKSKHAKAFLRSLATKLELEIQTDI
jgi:hypothetical protein